LRTGWHGLEYHSPRCGAVLTRGASGNVSYPKHGDGLVSGCANTARMTCDELSEDLKALSEHVTGRTGKPSIIAHF